MRLTSCHDPWQAHIRCRVRKAEHSIFQVATAIVEGDAVRLDAAVTNAVARLILLDPKAKDQPVDPGAATRDLPAETPKKKDDPPDSAKSPETSAGQASRAAGECDPDTPLLSLPGNRTEVLIGLLRGTQVLFKKRGAAPPIVRRDVDGTLQGVRFVPASIGRARGVPYEDVGTLLDKYCRPYTYVRRGLLTLAVDLAWTSYPEDKNEDKNEEHRKKRRIAVAYAVSKLECESGSDRNTLVTKLA